MPSESVQSARNRIWTRCSPSAPSHFQQVGGGIGVGHLAAFSVHLALFGLAVGSVALAVGAGTGRRGLATGIASAVAVLGWRPEEPWFHLFRIEIEDLSLIRYAPSGDRPSPS